MAAMIDLKRELEVWKGVRTFRRLEEITGLPASYLCDAIKGRKPPSEKLLAHLGLRKTIVYERIAEPAGSNGHAGKRKARAGNGG